MSVALLGLGAIALLALIRGVRFRRGQDRSYLGLYRNTNLPAVYRHLPLVLPFGGGYLLAILVAAALERLVPPEEADPVLNLLLVTLIPLAGILMCVVAIVRMPYPPSWLTPRWLTDEDRSIGYERPKLGWADYGWLLIAAVGVLGGLVMLAYVGFVLISHRAW
ncbi:MAG TPA: hypothetical protein VFI40_09570 [Nocardioides sp.]|nr:hypothetical protein [Nocardioides sp.]